MASASEFAFQNEMIQQLVANGWLLGKPEHYNRELALYSEDLLGFVKDTQDGSGKNSVLYILMIPSLNF
jgi:type I restriction enzyme R subunit